VAATSSPQGPLLAPPLLFVKGKETGGHPQIPFPVRRPDSGYGIPAPSSRRGAAIQPERLAPLWQTLRFPRWRIFAADPETC
jgi:hypothetical protein